MFTRKTNTFERICFNVRTYVSQYLFTAYVRTYIVTFERICFTFECKYIDIILRANV